MIILGHEDIVNMVCGLNCGCYEMQLINDCGGKGLYSYTGGMSDNFKWDRRNLQMLSDKSLLALYTGIKDGMNGKQKQAVAQVQCEAKTKRCYYKCSNCGNDEIGGEDKFCSACGMELKREFEEKGK